MSEDEADAEMNDVVQVVAAPKAAVAMEPQPSKESASTQATEGTLTKEQYDVLAAQSLEQVRFRMYVCMYVCMFVRTYVCMYVCTYICVCMYAVESQFFAYGSVFKCMHVMFRMCPRVHCAAPASLAVQTCLHTCACT
jgi:hypothetical protein